MYSELLLSDEKFIGKNDYTERKVLRDEFTKLPVQFFSKLRHFQPQIGCLNSCAICSKYASCNVEFWNQSRIRNVIAALKYSSPSNKKPLIVWDRDNHISGVIFSYLDNDVGNYYYLDEFIRIAYNELGVRTRISTVGYSRYNNELNRMHETISKNSQFLAGVRLSFTPYAIGWCSKNSGNFSQLEYMKDMANFLKIYKPYYEKVGSGARKFCVELRYKPLAVNEKVFIFEYKGYFIVFSGSYLYRSKKKNIKFTNTIIKDPYIHELSLNNDGECFFKLKLNTTLKTENEIRKFLDDNFNKIEEEVTMYKIVNKDGEYYSVNPILTDKGNNGLYFYPTTSTRKKSGYIITERFFLNALFKYKSKYGLGCDDKFNEATWGDVDNVFKELKVIAKEYYNRKYNEKYVYIMEELLPMLDSYKNAIKLAGYSPAVFFDKDFTIDTGTICNLGRAINQFKGLVSIENEPLTLNHERNYGKINSTMTKEENAWRLSCDYEDNLIIESLDLASTATMDGQVRYVKNIKLCRMNEKLHFNDINNIELIPGQKELKK